MVRRPRSPVLLAATIALCWYAPAEANHPKPSPCSEGRYIFDSGQLVVGAAASVVDALDLRTKQISLAGCPVARPRLRATKRGTKVRAKWKGCSGLRGKVKLTALIATGCQHMTGILKVPKRKPFRFGATLSSCGNGIVEPNRGEECEGDETCGPGTHCSLACRCRAPSGGGGTTTTTLPPPGLTIRWILLPPSIIDSGQVVPLSLEVSGCGQAVDGNLYACSPDVPVSECTGSDPLAFGPDRGHFAGAPGTFSFTAQGLQCAGVADYYVVAAINLADAAGNLFGLFPSPPVAIRLRPAGSVLDVDTDSLSFDLQPGRTPPAQTLSLFSACGEAFPFNLSASAPWLTVTPASGSLDADGTAALTVGVDPSRLDPGGGPFTATIAIDSSATNSPATISVTLDVVDASARWTTPPPSQAGSDQVFPLALEVTGPFQRVEGDVVACTPDVQPGDCFDTGPIDFGPDAGHFAGPPGTFTFQAHALDCSGPEDFYVAAQYVVTDASGNVFGPFSAPQTPTRFLAPAGPVLLADPDTLDVGAMVGQAAAQTVTLFTACGEPVSFAGVGADAPWLSVSPAAGTIAQDDSVDLTVSIDPGGLDPAGSPFHATISVPSAATNSPLAVPVTLDLAGPVVIGWTTVPPGSVATNQQFPVVLQVSGWQAIDGDVVACTTDVPVDQCFDSGVFALAPSSGHFTGPAGTFAFTASGFDCNGPERIYLVARFFLRDAAGDFTIGPFFGPTTATTVKAPGGPFLVIDPAALAFDLVVGQSPASQTLNLSSACGEALSWRSIDANAPWLSAAPHAGPIAAGSTADVTVTVDPAGLGGTSALGGTLTFTAPATNGPVAVPVAVNLLDCRG